MLILSNISTKFPIYSLNSFCRMFLHILVSMCFLTCKSTISSKILDKTGNKEICLVVFNRLNPPIRWNSFSSFTCTWEGRCHYLFITYQVSRVLMVKYNLLSKIFEILSSPLVFLFESYPINIVICGSCIS